MSFLKALLRKFVIPLAILAVGIFMMRLVIASGPEPVLGQLTPADERPLVNSHLAQAQAVPPQLLVWAEVQAKQQVDLQAPGNSRVTQVLVALGEQVNEGQVLVQLDDRPIQAQLLQAQAQIDALQAQIASSEQRFRSDRELLNLEQGLVEAAKREMERQRTLAGRNLNTPAQLEQAENALAQRQLSSAQRRLAVDNQANDRLQLQAQLAQLNAQKTLLVLQQQDLQLVSPFTGQISRLDARVGERASNAALLRVQSLDWQFQAWVAGERLSAPIQAARQLDGTLLSDSVFVANELRSGALELRFSSDLPGFMPGQQQRILLDLMPIHALLLPEISLYPGNQVFVVRDGLLQATPVTLLGRRWQDGQPWVLVAADEALALPILSTRLNEASTGLAVKLAQEN